MPVTSPRQQKAAGAARSARRGETRRSALSGASRAMADSMSGAAFHRLASSRGTTPPTRSAKC